MGRGLEDSRVLLRFFLFLEKNCIFLHTYKWWKSAFYTEDQILPTKA
jgi:hypothetical protein